MMSVDSAVRLAPIFELTTRRRYAADTVVPVFRSHRYTRRILSQTRTYVTIQTRCSDYTPSDVGTRVPFQIRSLPNSTAFF